METVKEKKQAAPKLDVQTMLKEYVRLGTPGAPHKLLEKLAGSWISKTKSWIDPDEPPMESSGTSENVMIHDGRFLHQVYTDTMMGKPVAGTVIVGYDNNTKKYVTIALGSMGTGMYLFEGTASPDGKTISQESQYVDPFRGPITYHTKMKQVDNDTYMFEMSSVDKSGKETKMMETTYSRKK